MTGRIMRIVTASGACTLLAAFAAGCNDPSAAPSVSTIAQTSTTYVTIPARTTSTTAAPSANDANPSGDSESTASDDPDQERIHEIQSGDYLVGIARDYDVPINYIPEYNGWDDGLGHALVPGEEIRIPPANWDPGGEDADDSSAASDGSSPAVTGPPCEDGAAGETYEIRAGDTPARVAQEFGVTVDELNAANENTQFYSGFVVGITINIPC